jgi:hypothetical protein
VKLQSVDGRRWAAFKRFDIPDMDRPDRTYLRRWRIVETPWFGVKVHHILMTDSDRAHHDHPWSFVSLILRGGYEESIRGVAETVRRRRRPGRWHRMPAEGLHRITTLYGRSCWTLVVNGPRRREWGFVEPGSEWVDWRTYTGAVTS